MALRLTWILKINSDENLGIKSLQNSILCADSTRSHGITHSFVRVRLVGFVEYDYVSIFKKKVARPVNNVECMEIRFEVMKNQECVPIFNKKMHKLKRSSFLLLLLSYLINTHLDTVNNKKIKIKRL